MVFIWKSCFIIAFKFTPLHRDSVSIGAWPRLHEPDLIANRVPKAHTHTHRHTVYTITPTSCAASNVDQRMFFCRSFENWISVFSDLFKLLEFTWMIPLNIFNIFYECVLLQRQHPMLLMKFIEFEMLIVFRLLAEKVLWFSMHKNRNGGVAIETLWHSRHIQE